MNRIFALLLGLAVLFQSNSSVLAQTPNQQVSRIQALYFVVEAASVLRNRAAFYAENLPPVGLFRDVPQDTSYAPYLEAAFEYRVLPGVPDRLLYPNQPLLTESALALVLRLHGDRSPLTEKWFHLRGETSNDISFHQLLERAEQQHIPLPPLHIGQPITWEEFRILLGIEEISAMTQEPISSHPFLSQKSFAITMPTLGIYDLSIIHPNDPVTHDGLIEPLRDGVGHLFSYPGQGGNVLIYGHSSGYPWDVSQYTRIFRQVNRLNEGDAIYVTREHKVYEYFVTKKETIPARDVSSLQDSNGEELILYTCWPPDSTSQRYLVRARPASEYSQQITSSQKTPL